MKSAPAPVALLLAAVVVVALSGFFPSEALACGASAGSGGVAVCTLDELREEARKKWRVGSSYTYSRTGLNFSGAPLPNAGEFEQERHAALVVGEWRPHPRWSLQLSAGSLLTGSLWVDDESFAMNPGVVGALGGSFVAVRPDGAVPFVLATGQLSTVITSTDTDTSYSAVDARVGVLVGWNLFKVFSPYVLARAFGGPISWEYEGAGITGTDRYHYQLGAGASVLIAYRVDLYLEGVALGEQGLSAGVGFAF